MEGRYRIASGATMIALFIIATIAFNVSAVGNNSTLFEAGTATSTILQGNDVSNLVTVNFPTPYLRTPFLGCCPFTTAFTGVQPFGLTWSTVFVPQQIRNATNPSFDTSARHDQNNSTCAPCTNKVTITPGMPDEVLIIHIFYISDAAISVSSVTSPGLVFTKYQPFGAGAGIEDWAATTYTIAPMTITVTFSAPGSTIVTTSVIATTFSNSLGVVGVTSGSSSTSPITVVNNNPLLPFTMIVGDTWLTDAGTACHDPSPGSGQTQVLNANVFCLTNINGATPFLYNYDVEYFNQGFGTSYNYLTNFNGTSPTGLSINLQLAGGGHHDRVWNIGGSTTNSTLYNTEQFDTPLNPPFQSQLGVSSFSGRFGFMCNYASANVSLTMNLQANFTGVFTNTFGFTIFSGNACNGQLHTFNIQNTFGLADNFMARVIASCVCASNLQVSISNMFIGWRMLGQNIVRESLASLTNTGFSVRFSSVFPEPSGQTLNWRWNATGI